MQIENLNITPYEISWERSKSKLGSEIIYKSRIFKAKGHLTIVKEMYVDGKVSHCDLVHIPIELIKELENLK